MSGTMRAVLTAAVIFGLLLSFTFRQTDVAKVSAQTSENEIVASPESADVPFTNASPITINDSPTPPTLASRYPSQITVPVEGPNLTTVTKVQVKLFGFTHTFPDDLDIILVGPQGQRAMLMSDAGGSDNVSNINLTFSPAATTILPDSTALTTGEYRPANYETTDTFPAPGPGVLTNAPTDLSVFNLTNPNGVWSLYIVDDAQQDAGEIAFGWTLVLTVPQIFTVNSTSDESDSQGCNLANCSLPEAITEAQNGDLINFSSAFNTPQTIDLTFSTLNINRSVTIQGPGANLLTVRRALNATTDFRIFTIPAGVANGVAISGMTITGGRVIGFGGGIDSESNLTLTNVHVTGNQASKGGGVSLAFANGSFTGCTFSGNTASVQGGGMEFRGDGGRSLQIINSTISSNTSGNVGGGIYHLSLGGLSTLAITNSTIAGNTATSAGINNAAGAAGTVVLTLRNSIIANNTGANLISGAEPGGTATITTQGFNLSNDFTGGGFIPLSTDITTLTPRLGALSLGGGTTPTHALLGGSPAINAGDASGFATDQRGQPRLLIAGTADIGAVEMRPIIVSNTNDAGAGSLRQAIASANSIPDLDDILFDNTVFSTAQTINLLSALPNITSNLTINGAGANLLTVQRDGAAANFRIFSIAGGITGGVVINGMTISNGRVTAPGDAGFGGGIRSLSNLTLTGVHVRGNEAGGGGGGVDLFQSHGVFTGCTFSLNTATLDGGGIRHLGNGRTLRVASSTVSGNSSSANGGGIFNVSFSGHSGLEIVNSTIADNTAVNGGGIRTFTNLSTSNTATTTLRNTIIAGNTPNNLTEGTAGGGMRTVTTHGFNLANDDGGNFLNVAPITTDKINTAAGLAALADNGGATPTRALLSGSEAIDAGNNSGSGVLTDQRGGSFRRTVNLPPTNANSDDTDIGAFEAQTEPPLPTISVNDTTTAEGDPAIFTITLSAASGQTVTLTYNTTGGTATADVDYNNQNAPATLTFAPGTTTQTVSVTTFEDSTFELDETFNLNILSAVNATIADNQGIGTIQNDDPQPTISISDVSQNEGNSGTTPFNFNVTLSNPSSQTITVSHQTADNTATAPADYAAINATVLTFNPGETSKPVSVSVVGDGVVEPNETFFVNLSAPTNATIADNQGIGTIQNDDNSQTFTVINTDDAGAGSLRQAVTDANNNSAPDTINFSALFNTPQTINLAAALPDITSSVTINGTGAHLLTVRRAFDAATDFRIFNIQNLGLNITISGMTISNGRLSAPGGSFGGGISSNSFLTLTNVHVTGNHATNGGGGVSVAAAGGVFTGCTFSGNTTITGAGAITYQGGGGTLRLVNSTVSGNSTAGNGGGIFVLSNVANNRLELVNSTIANNSGGSGGGIRTSGSFATTTLRNTIVAGNTPNNLTTEGGATVMTNGFNLSDNFNGVFTLATTDRTGQPRLAPLSLIGGQTPTHALLGDSPALDAGDSSGSGFDQRGQPRAFDTPGVPHASDFADIGAVEMRSIIVTNADNASAGSLRQVITAAPANSDILFDPTFFNVARAVTLTTGEIVINQNLNIHGTGANLLTVSGNNQSRVFFINSGITASLNGMTITGGNGAGAVNSGFGGGIHNFGNLTISDSAVSGNNANFGGGILSALGTFSLRRSTVSNNTAAFNGGGLNLQNGNGTLTNSTISGNTANNSSNAGGGVWFASSGGSSTLQATSCTIADNTTGTPNTGGGLVTFGNGGTASATSLLRNTIIANNSLPNLRRTTLSGGAAAIMSQGFNLASDNDGNFLTAPSDKVNVNPLLATLRNNNGTTQTHALLGGSPALDAGNSSGSTTDQRGNRRPVDLSGIINAAGGDGTDIGAFEAQLMPTADDILIEGFVRTARGAPIVGAIITLSGSAQETMPTDGDGHYRFTVPSGGSYQVNVSARGFRFSPAQQTFGSLVVNQVADFMALPAKGRTSPRPRVR